MGDMGEKSDRILSKDEEEDERGKEKGRKGGHQKGEGRKEEERVMTRRGQEKV